MTSTSWIIVGTAFFAAGSAGLLGALLVLRRMSLIGDAISHAVLPGIVLAFLFTQSRDPWLMMLGAGAAGLATTIFIEWLSRRGVAEDAATGIVFSALFAVGVLLVSLFGDHVDLDADCVLYGDLALIPLSPDFPAGSGIPRQMAALLVVYLLNIGLLSLFYKEWKISTFDPALATSFGISAGLLHYVLMGAVSLTTVTGFEATGAILIVAMFIAPGATAVLLFDRFGAVLLATQVLAALSALGGYWLARSIDGSVAGAMSTVAGLLFVIAVMIAPQRGVVPKWLAKRRMRRRIELEDLIGLLYRSEERREEVRGHALTPSVVRRAVRAKLIELSSRGYVLTATGKPLGATLIRSHRLLESYLESELNLPADHTHDTADAVEHYLDDASKSLLERLFGGRNSDPQGKPIPKI